MANYSASGHWRPDTATASTMIVGVAALLMAVPLCAQTVTADANGLLSIRAHNMPLSAVLQAISTIRPFDKLVIDPKVQSAPVAVDLADVSVRDAIIAVLSSAHGVDYVLSASADGEGMRLVASAATRAEPTPQAPVSIQPALKPEVEISTRSGRKERQLPEAARSDMKQEQGGGAARTSAELQHLTTTLTTAQNRPRPGDRVQLPFPGPNGEPLIVTLPPNTRSTKPAGSTIRSPVRSPAMTPTQPGLRELYELLLRAPHKHQ